MFMGKHQVLLLICIFCVSNMQPGIWQVDTISTADGKRITFLADGHEMNVKADEQVGGVLDYLRQREKDNKSTHVLVEQPSSWLSDLLGCDSQVLLHLPKKIKQANPKFTLTTYENIEVRRIGAAARDMIWYPFNADKNWVIDGTKKTLGTFTFQDVLDEFAQTKQMLSDYYSSQDAAVANIYTKFMTQADGYYTELVQMMKNKNISPNEYVLKYSKNMELLERSPLVKAVLNTFSPFFDLNAIRVILTSSHKNMVVVAGDWHTQGICSSLEALNGSSLYSTCWDVGPRKELSIERIQQGLAMQEQSLIRMYAPVVVGKVVIVTFCYLFFAAVVQTMMQGAILT